MMRAEFGWEMTDDLVRTANDVLLRHLLRGITWPKALVGWLLSVALLIVTLATGSLWVWSLLAGAAAMLFFIITMIAYGMPQLQKARSAEYLAQIAGWPHRRVSIAITPDAIELTTPTGHGLVELADLKEIVHDPRVTILLFRGGQIVPVPTDRVPPAARTLLRFPEADAPNS